MPRQARLDAPGTLHHVMLRGIERRAIVTDNADRHEFVSRLRASAMQSRTSVYGWALLTNHAHLLLRSGPDGLPRLMRRFLTGYAQAYNRRHQRHGHLFQNRYKSIECEEDRYFVELLRYIHLNPLRARLVRTLSELERYPWSGHGVVLGEVAGSWQEREWVLSWFGKTADSAIQAYREFVAEGVGQERRPELVGGGQSAEAGGEDSSLAGTTVSGRVRAVPGGSCSPVRGLHLRNCYGLQNRQTEIFPVIQQRPLLTHAAADRLEGIERCGVAGDQGVEEMPQGGQGLVFGRAVAGELVNEAAGQAGGDLG